MAEDATAPGAIGTLLRGIGTWGQPSGRGLFMFRLIALSTGTSALTGVLAATVSAIVWGTGALGFAIGASIGFTCGAYFYFKTSVANGLSVLQTHTQLMKHHLVRNFRFERYDRVDVSTAEKAERFAEELDATWRGQSALACAYQTAAFSLDEIHAREEASIIDELSQRKDE